MIALDRIVASALPSNLASQRVMEKLEMDYEGELDHAGFLHRLYASQAPRPASAAR